MAVGFWPLAVGKMQEEGIKESLCGSLRAFLCGPQRYGFKSRVPIGNVNFVVERLKNPVAQRAAKMSRIGPRRDVEKSCWLNERYPVRILTDSRADPLGMEGVRRQMNMSSVKKKRLTVENRQTLCI